MGAGKINLLNKGVIMTRNLSVWNSLRPFSVGFDSIFDEFDRMLESTERYNTQIIHLTIFIELMSTTIKLKLLSLDIVKKILRLN